MRYVLLILVACLLSCKPELDTRNLASYKLVFCDSRKPEYVYCDDVFPVLENHGRSVPEFRCDGMNGGRIVKLNVCDTVCISRTGD